MIPPLLILCLGKTWPLDTVVFVDDAVFDDFAQVLHLNLTGRHREWSELQQHNIV